MDETVDGFLDYKAHPVRRSTSGGWTSASFIIAVELAERFAYFGIASNLISYLTGPLGQSTATAAENVNTWSGTAALLPLLGGVVADSFLGRFRTVIVASLIYILGLGLLTLSAALTSLDISECENINNGKSCSPPWFLMILFFSSLYLVALGQGAHKPCLQAFGADQFDGQDPEESRAKSSFFNWWYFSTAVGINITLVVVIYIQENLNWVLGFGIPCLVMLAALLVFLLGTKTYRYSIKKEDNNSLTQIGRAIRGVVRYRRTSAHVSIEENQSSEASKFLSEGLLAEDREAQSISHVEEIKAFVRLIPIWSTSLVYAIVFAQTTTFFTKQGVTMDRTISAGFQIPAASLQTFIGFAIIVLIPVYDRVFIPVVRYLTGNPSGITMLQRIGTGMCASALSMVIAAIVEKKRLETAKEYGMIDLPNDTIPMSIWWLVPQYVLCGVSDVFTIVGLQEFFYDQVPEDFRSVGLSLYLSVIGVGNFLSSFIVYAIDKISGRNGEESWFSSNLNKAHLDYFYCLLAGLSALGFFAYLYFARSYIYRRACQN
ncbi:protein NRT1/ PTR FAMILY 5.10-like [Euphorbia lathyris]|uniref:protein NRT1/ PTR FAMILY 5.10-like n=1 Tax=Euphorbia lathyris TaxID=212925 RepID=UPI003313E3FE